MREIKFRAWNGRKMFEVDVLAINGVGWDSGGTGVSLAYQPSVKVMQYTGLKDKNGVEIYEGDLVKSALTRVAAEIAFDKLNACYVGVDLTDKYTWGFNDLLAFNTAKVIGNIYENPELLKV